MLEKVLQLLAVSCRHRHTSQPFTAASSYASAATHSSDWETVGNGPSHYVVCLDCGKKFAYDWSEMRIVR